MSRPAIQSIRLSDNVTLSECHPDSECRTNNWWLYDERAGMNISMRAKTRDEALFDAIEFWADRATACESSYAALKGRVDAFVCEVIEPEDCDD